MFDKERNLFGGHGIVGGQIGLAAGIAFADKYRDEDHVTVCFFGDGAARQGILHEAFNMAMTWKLPVVYIVENNRYAMGTSVERTSNVTDLHKIGDSYEMPSASADGMSPESVAEAIAIAADHCRSGKGPFLLDIQSDPQKYRLKQEVAAFIERDPIEAVRKVLLAQKWMSESELKDVDDAVRAKVEEAIKFAEESPKPDASELYEDVYATPNYPFVKD
jgi:pyruvate dehydrogenase E1 component alpha subunit